MTVISNSYLTILKEKRIVYMPTCLIMEKMARLQGRVSRIRSHSDLVEQLDDVVFLVGYFKYELHCTAKAYEEMRLMFFIGDWKEDRLRARKIFVNLLDRLSYFAAYVREEKREELLELVEDLEREWDMLVRILDEKSGVGRIRQGAATCRYFRGVNPEQWRQVMARAAFLMDDFEECRDSDTFLLVLCYPRIREQILREVKRLETRNNMESCFSAEKVVCASDADMKIDCASCMTITEGAGHLDSRRGARPGGSVTRVAGTRVIRRVRDTHVAAYRNGVRSTTRIVASRGKI